MALHSSHHGVVPLKNVIALPECQVSKRSQLSRQSYSLISTNFRSFMGCAPSRTPAEREQAKMSATSKVKDLVAGNKVMVFSKSYCPYCAKAKSAIDSVTKNYKVLEVRLLCHRLPAAR